VAARVVFTGDMGQMNYENDMASTGAQWVALVCITLSAFVAGIILGMAL